MPAEKSQALALLSDGTRARSILRRFKYWFDKHFHFLAQLQQQGELTLDDLLDLFNDTGGPLTPSELEAIMLIITSHGMAAESWDKTLEHLCDPIDEYGFFEYPSDSMSFLSLTGSKYWRARCTLSDAPFTTKNTKALEVVVPLHMPFDTLRFVISLHLDCPMFSIRVTINGLRITPEEKKNLHKMTLGQALKTPEKFSVVSVEHIKACLSCPLLSALGSTAIQQD